MFLKVFSNDISSIEVSIAEKRKRLGMTTDETQYKLRDIDKRMRLLGGRLELTHGLLDLDNMLSNRDELEDNESESSESEVDDQKSAGKSSMRRSATSRSNKSRR